MKINKSIERITKINLHCGEWRACIQIPHQKKDVFSLWHIKESKRNDMTVDRKSIEDLKMLVGVIIDTLESEE